MDTRMAARLEQMTARARHLEAELSRPEVVQDQVVARRHGKELARLGPVVDRYAAFLDKKKSEDDLRRLMREDPELRQLAEAELEEVRRAAAELEDQLRKDLLPRDAHDDKNVLVEVRAGTGGEEAALFAADLLRMYLRYAERHGWRVEMLSDSATDIGGFKEVVVLIEGDAAYSRLKFESGVHRVQRVPSTEAQGRIHTSAATVAVLPEAEELDLEINPEDLKIETMRAGGAGGQHVNKTESAVRITHLPTGISVHAQDERSQHKNRDKAMRILMARVQDLREKEQQSEVASARRALVGSGDRSERIRTYNFPQNRVTDHRIGLTLHRLEAIMDGDLDELVEALTAAQDQARLGQPAT
jgi:peptide chain release factor 1